jgi:ATP-dependent Zn protease
MATKVETLALPAGEASRQLADQWRRLTRAATFVAVLSSPAVFAWFYGFVQLSFAKSLLVTFLLVIAFRGLVDLGFRRAIPWPSLFGSDSPQLREEDVSARKRVWFWRFWTKLAVYTLIVAALAFLFWVPEGTSFFGTFGWFKEKIGLILSQPQLWIQVVFVFFLFIANFGILFGPLLAMNLTQVRVFEPGDAEWGVKLEDVRGQAEAKEEVRRVVSLWQSGEAFERAGGKRERGVLFLGPPGTGKTMLAKAIATGFNSPFVSIPGSGFAATFIGIDAIVVRYVAWRAKRVARKWGGQCIVFIDEIDAIGRRRSMLGQPGFGGAGGSTPSSVHDLLFFGPYGALNASGDLILETRQWRERLFAERMPRVDPAQAWLERLGPIARFMFPGMGGMGGSLALNQLLVVMDGIENPPWRKRFRTSKINNFLEATYLVPARIGRLRLRLPAPRPRKEQVYFIGATNVPMDQLDPALTRPGRMGRHVWFRTPTKHDREDIFELYLGKVSHGEDLNRPERRDELARITNGYSPAMIEQVVSMALTIAHHTGRETFGWEDITEAMTTIETGTAINIEYVPDETRAVAIHEAGHAVCGHVYMKDNESTRLSIRMRGGSLGHHQAREKQERFSRFRSEEFARLVWALGAMAAERVFYGENSTGVGGDVQSVTAQAAWMVGASAMGPELVEIGGKFADESEEETRARIMRRFEQIGLQIMNRTSGGGPMAMDPISSVLTDRDKRKTAAQILGQAYVAAHNLVAANREGVEKVADELVERKELFGDDLVKLLNSLELETPEVDYTEETAWPKI